MSKDEGSGWSAAYLMQTTEDMAKAVVAAAAAAKSANVSRPSVIFSTKDENKDGKLYKLQHQVSKMLKGFSSNSPVGKGLIYNPEVLTSQKRQWASIQLQHLDNKFLKEPTKLFESVVVVGLHPHCDISALQRQYAHKKIESYNRLPSSLAYSNHSRIEPVLEPQVLFVYPPEKQLPLKYKDLVSFCFPGGLEVNAVEKTPSMSELNEILLGQAHLKHSDQQFIFRLQVADNSTLYGCCMLIEEIVHRPSGLLSAIASEQYSSPPSSSLSRYILTTPRCYCILSRLPFFELHFDVLNSVFIEERLERLKQDIIAEANAFRSRDIHNFGDEIVKDSLVEVPNTSGNCFEDEKKDVKVENEKNHNSSNDVLFDSEVCDVTMKLELSDKVENHCEDNNASNHHDQEMSLPPNMVLPVLRLHQDETSEGSSSYLQSPCEERAIRSGNDIETDEASFSGRDVSFRDNSSVLEWAKEKKFGSLQMICEYYKINCPNRGSTIRFHPLDHLQPLEYQRLKEADLHIAGSTVNLNSCSTSLELAEAQSALFAEEEASSLSTWAISCLCGSLRLEHILTIFAGVLLEKQIVVVSSNLGLLSALVLATIPLIRPYRWQSLLMPILPDDMLDFLDAPVPYIVGVKIKTSEVQSKINCAILVDANKNQVKSSNMPQLPKYRELYSALSPYHAQLVGESFLAQKRPMYCCTPTQVDGVKRFLDILRLYLNSLCSNLRSHTITNVQSNNDKVSLLLKESFIDSFPSRDRSFMKLFVDTQLFSVHTDFVLSLIQKE